LKIEVGRKTSTADEKEKVGGSQTRGKAFREQTAELMPRIRNKYKRELAPRSTRKNHQKGDAPSGASGKKKKTSVNLKGKSRHRDPNRERTKIGSRGGGVSAAPGYTTAGCTTEELLSGKSTKAGKGTAGKKHDKTTRTGNQLRLTAGERNDPSSLEHVKHRHEKKTKVVES